jgi:hypothetical protein
MFSGTTRREFLAVAASPLAFCAPSPVSLFDGRTLKGWVAVPRLPVPQYPGAPEPMRDSEQYRKAAGTRGRWSVESGAIVGGQDPPGSGVGAYLVTEGTFGDFELTLDANPDWAADTGVMVRASAMGSQGFQIHVDHRREGSIGTFYGNGIGGFRVRHYAFDVRRDEQGHPVGLRLVDVPASEKVGLLYATEPEAILRAWRFLDWNTLRIRVVGALPKLTTWINGLKVAELDASMLKRDNYYPSKVLDLLGPRGHIALEVHDNDAKLGPDRWAPGAVCRWRNIALVPL